MNRKLKFIITTVWILLSRAYDVYATYKHTPDLTKEANPLVSVFGFNWTFLLVVVLVFSVYVIYTYYLAIFHPYNLEPKQQGYTFSHFIGYIYTGNKQSWISLFYKFPKDLKRLNYYSGQLLSRCLVFAGIVSTIMWLLINNTEFYKNIHSVTIIYLILIIGCVIICYRWFNRKYSVYISTTK